MNKFEDLFFQYKYLYLACIVAFFVVPLSSFLISPESLPKAYSIYYVIDIVVMSLTSFIMAVDRFRWYYPITLTFLLFIATASEGIIPVLTDELYSAEFVKNLVSYTLMTYLAGWAGVSYRKLRFKN